MDSGFTDENGKPISYEEYEKIVAAGAPCPVDHVTLKAVYEMFFRDVNLGPNIQRVFPPCSYCKEEI